MDSMSYKGGPEKRKIKNINLIKAQVEANQKTGEKEKRIFKDVIGETQGKKR